ncbi:carbon-nitrogen hydrolase family protein [Nitriliruptoraceae bacterium ZYF776]|nr:carbon-nitrogen hydrolase family protein [Profundirhabdus halotolerans]
MTVRIGTLAAHFRRDVEHDLDRLAWVLRDAFVDRLDLVVIPHGAIGGYHDGLDGTERTTDLPPAITLDGPELERVRLAARSTVVCLGVTEDRGARRANTAVCLDGDGILGVHRKVHLPRGEVGDYEPGRELAAFDTPVGRIGMLVDYDKTFPETARALASDGARLLAVPSAWPASRTATTASLTRDRERRMFDLYDQARAAENQVVVASANQTGRHGELRFFGRSKVVAPDGDLVAVVGGRAGMAVAELDLDAVVERARRRFHHLDEHRATYPDGRLVDGTSTRR